MNVKNLEVNQKNFMDICEKNLTKEEKIQRNLHLKRILSGEVSSPLTNIPNIDKEWLKYYTEEQLKRNYVPEETMYSYMKRDNLNHLDDIAINYFGKEISYMKFFKQIDDCAKSFIKNGIGEGDIVTICMPSTPETLISFYALNKIGAVANMVHPLSSENEIKYFVNRVKSKMIITIDATYEKVRNIVGETNLEKVVTVTPKDSMPFPLSALYSVSSQATRIKDTSQMTKWKDFIKEGNDIEEIKEVPYKKDKSAAILQTGGTTGTPKGVVLTNENFNSMVEQFKVNAENFKRGDNMLAVMPPFHGFGLCSSNHLPLSYGVTVNLIPKVNINKIDKLMKKHKINHIVAVPTLFKGMMMVINKKEKEGKLKNFDLSGLKYAVSGGALAKNGFESNVDNFFHTHGTDTKLCKGYGLSEAVAGVTFATGDMKDENTVGIPMVDTSIKIVDPETKETLPNEEIGEICIQGPTVMKEYYDNIEETEATLIDGWLHTGDLGYMKEGQLYFSERKGNMIISSGVNVYPNEIEQVIESHQAVSACAVIGIYHPYKEEVPKAYVVLKPEYEMSEEINEEIQDLCKKNLNRYSIPASIEYRESLPQTLLGKISHIQLKKEEEATNEKVMVYKKETSK